MNARRARVTRGTREIIAKSSHAMTDFDNPTAVFVAPASRLSAGGRSLDTLHFNA